MTPLLYLFLGLAFGGVIGWLLGTRRQPPAPANTQLEGELRQQIQTRAAEVDDLRGQLMQANTARATADAKQATAEKLLAEHRQLYERQLAEAKQAQEKALGDLRVAFQALSAEALSKAQPEFLQLATQTLAQYQEAAKGDLAQRQQAIATLVKPLEEQLKTYQQRLAQSETSQSSALGEVKKHLETLAQQSQSLSNETLQLLLPDSGEHVAG